MNPDTKSILDEIQKQFAEQTALLDKRFNEAATGWDQKFAEFETQKDERISKIESIAASLDEWRPSIDGLVDDLKLEVGKLTKHWGRSVREREVGHTGLLSQFELAPARLPAGDPASRPNGHHVADIHRADGYGVVTTLTPLPVKDQACSW
ncbi:uncharacterized protein LOC120661815 isoform X1 [Panicum virgatum]|uniref:uncharacterized protein LOC120661815 isoform X1 n=1 Tax=Panicum virgatum TaxID=38727 RepID=UPI0019D5AE84|nr:uncharacterized protein LOC120661815 isoform X1 [Panicum virgatum]